MSTPGTTTETRWAWSSSPKTSATRPVPVGVEGEDLAAGVAQRVVPVHPPARVLAAVGGEPAVEQAFLLDRAASGERDAGWPGSAGVTGAPLRLPTTSG